MVINSLSAMLLAILCKNILWYENRKNEKRKRRKKERKEKNRLLLTLFTKYLRRLYDPSIEIYHHGERFWIVTYHQRPPDQSAKN